MIICFQGDPRVRPRRPDCCVHQKGCFHVSLQHHPLGFGSPEPALAAGHRDLLSTTQTRLATGKKVNSALDNPTNFFTASGLDARASDIGNLLDSIGNGVQVLQAANTGITSLSKLVDTAKSIANQALQQPGGYSTKASLELSPVGRRRRHDVSASDLQRRQAGGPMFTFKTDDRHGRRSPRCDLRP